MSYLAGTVGRGALWYGGTDTELSLLQGVLASDDQKFYPDTSPTKHDSAVIDYLTETEADGQDAERNGRIRFDPVSTER